MDMVLKQIPSLAILVSTGYMIYLVQTAASSKSQKGEMLAAVAPNLTAGLIGYGALFAYLSYTLTNTGNTVPSYLLAAAVIGLYYVMYNPQVLLTQV
jgi:hypothetical protein